MAENEIEVGQSRSKGSLVTTLLLIVNIGVGAATFIKVFKTPKPHIVQVMVKGTGGEGGHGEGGEDHGAAKTWPTMPLDPFVVNLNEMGKPRYLKATFELQLEDENSKKVIEERKNLIKDDILRYLSGLAVADCQGEENKLKIQREIQKRVEKVAGEETVRRVLFVEFVIQ